MQQPDIATLEDHGGWPALLTELVEHRDLSVSQARAAMDQLEGTLTSALTAIDAALFDLAAKLEASLDFPDEGFHFVTPDGVRAGVDRQRRALGRLRQDGRAGRLLSASRIKLMSRISGSFLVGGGLWLALSKAK